MAQKEFKVGDRVVVNERNSTYQGYAGTVKYISGGQYWVKFDDSNEVTPALYP
jgi:ATP-dependent exoDNAse (exonuclease V) alpha subunit